MEFIQNAFNKIKDFFVGPEGVKAGSSIGLAAGIGLGMVTQIGWPAVVVGGLLGVFAGHVIEEQSEKKHEGGAKPATTGAVSKASLADQNTPSNMQSHIMAAEPVMEAPKGLPPKVQAVKGATLL